jgi:hypothetical protein
MPKLNPYQKIFADPKKGKYKNKKYLTWIKTLPCLICGKPSDPCHVRRGYWGSGMGTKSHDYCAIPLCRDHHNYANEREWGSDRQIAELLMEYIDNNGK